MRRLIAIALLALVLPARAQDKYAGVHTLAIVSVLGDITFTPRAEPFNFGPIWTLDAPDWKLDDRVAKTMAGLLAKRFTVKQVAYDRKAFPPLPPLHPFQDFFSESYADTLKRMVLALPNDDGIDAYVVVYPRWHDYCYGHRAPGLAVVMGPHGQSCICMNYAIEVVDVRSGDILGIVDGASSERGSYFDAPAAQPALFRIGKHWAATKEEFSHEHAANVEGAMLLLVDYSIPWTLYNAGLIEEAPDLPTMPHGTLPTPAP